MVRQQNLTQSFTQIVKLSCYFIALCTSSTLAATNLLHFSVHASHMQLIVQGSFNKTKVTTSVISYDIQMLKQVCFLCKHMLHF
jgi:hypothetical protein